MAYTFGFIYIDSQLMRCVSDTTRNFSACHQSDNMPYIPSGNKNIFRYWFFKFDEQTRYTVIYYDQIRTLSYYLPCFIMLHFQDWRHSKIYQADTCL